jgi:hypothetical protein
MLLTRCRSIDLAATHGSPIITRRQIVKRLPCAQYSTFLAPEPSFTNSRRPKASSTVEHIASAAWTEPSRPITLETKRSCASKAHKRVQHLYGTGLQVMLLKAVKKSGHIDTGTRWTLCRENV